VDNNLRVSYIVLRVIVYVRRLERMLWEVHAHYLRCHQLSK